MDEYGTYQHTHEDAQVIAQELKARRTIVFPYTHDRAGCIIVFISTDFTVPHGAVFPYGGNPRGRFYVGIYGRGCGHLSGEVGPHYSYLDEKLNLEGIDGEKFAEFYSWVLEHYHHKTFKEELEKL